MTSHKRIKEGASKREECAVRYSSVHVSRKANAKRARARRSVTLLLSLSLLSSSSSLFFFSSFFAREISEDISIFRVFG